MTIERRLRRVVPTRFRWMRPDTWMAAPGRLRTVLTSYPTQPLELFAGFGSLLRGIWWMLGPAGADAAAVRIEQLMPATCLGVSLLLLGLAQILGVALCSEALRRASAALIVGGTSLILVTSLVVDHTSRIIPSLFLIVLMEFIVVLRAGPWSDYPFGSKRMNDTGEHPTRPFDGRSGMAALKLVEGLAVFGVVAVVAKQTADRITAADMWLPVAISSVTTIVSLILAQVFQSRRIARRADLQAPAREFKLVQLSLDEGEQIRKELRIELEYKGQENQRLRKIIKAQEQHIQQLDEQVLLVQGQLRDCRQENARLRDRIPSMKLG